MWKAHTIRTAVGLLVAFLFQGVTLMLLAQRAHWQTREKFFELHSQAMRQIAEQIAKLHEAQDKRVLEIDKRVVEIETTVQLLTDLWKGLEWYGKRRTEG